MLEPIDNKMSLSFFGLCLGAICSILIIGSISWLLLLDIGALTASVISIIVGLIFAKYLLQKEGRSEIQSYHYDRLAGIRGQDERIDRMIAAAGKNGGISVDEYNAIAKLWGEVQLERSRAAALSGNAPANV